MNSRKENTAGRRRDSHPQSTDPSFSKIAVSLCAFGFGASVIKKVVDTIRLNRLMNGNLRLFAGSAQHYKTVQRLAKDAG